MCPNSNLAVSPLEQERMILLCIPWYIWPGFLNHLIDILDWVYLFISGTHKLRSKVGNSQPYSLPLFVYTIIRFLGQGELPQGFGFKFFSEVQLLIDKTSENIKTAQAPVGISWHSDVIPQSSVLIGDWHTHQLSQWWQKVKKLGSLRTLNTLTGEEVEIFLSLWHVSNVSSKCLLFYHIPCQSLHFIRSSTFSFQFLFSKCIVDHLQYIQKWRE